jgi:Arc/MetJ family transcription regulator
MRTNIVLDDELIEQAMRISQVKTKREMIDLALREFVSRHSQKNILDLVGQELIDPDYDVRNVREGMNRDSGR